MTGIEEIRNTFSKGNIVLSDGNISVIYSDQDWITQSMDGEHKSVFSGLLESSEKFSIRIKKGNSIRFGFISGENGQVAMYYSPLEKEMAKEEIDELLRNMNPSEEFMEFFNGVDLQDGDEVLEKIGEWTEKVSDRFKRKVRSVDKLRSWPEIKSKALRFANSNGCQTEIIEPDDISDGSIDIQVPEDLTRPLVFTDKNKLDLIELVDMCEEVALEMNSQEGYLNLLLFP